MIAWRPADFQEPSGDAIACTLCPHACALGDGDTGRCHVRRRRGGTLETATFATSVAHVQPIERKPLYHVRPGARALTLAAPGCSFACRYCQNFALSQFGRTEEAPWSAESVEPESIVARAVEASCEVIAFSYTEPVLAAELTLALAPLARSAGALVVWKTNGFVSVAAARRLAPALDAVNVDLKAAAEAPHRSLTGAPLAPVLEAMEAWASEGAWLEISTPLIPGVNDDDQAIREMARRVLACGAETPWHVVRFHPDYRLQDSLPTHPELLSRAVAIAEDAGLRHVYVERALGEAKRATRCPGCGATVVRRAIWALAESRLDRGKCPECGTRVAGRW